MSDTSATSSRPLRRAGDVTPLDRTAVRDLERVVPRDGTDGALGAAATRLGLALTRGSRTVAVSAPAGGPRRAPAPGALPPESWFLPLLAPHDEPDAPPVAVLAADRTSLVALADLALGGDGEAPERPASVVEAGVALRRVLAASAPLVAAVRATSPGSAPAAAASALRAGEPAPAPLLPTAAALDVWTFALTVPGTGARGSIFVGLPVHGSVARTAPAEPVAGDVLRRVPVEVVLVLPPLHLPASDVAELAAGDVVPFRQPADEPLLARLEGRPVLSGVLGRSGHRLALQVTTTCNEEHR